MSYKIPALGTVLLARFNENPEVLNPGPTRIPAEMIEWDQASTQDRAALLNEQRTANYLDRFEHSWLVNYRAGRLPADAVPPAPPAALVVVAIPESWRGALTAAEVQSYNGWVYFDVQPSGKAPVMGTNEAGEETTVEFGAGPFIPLCEVPAYQRLPK